MVIAIDGPAASGKSTVAKELARKMHAQYLDTGALYRTIALLALEKGIDPENEAALAKIAQNTGFDIRTVFCNNKVMLDIYVDGRNVSKDIRSPEVSGYVSEVARIPKVRKALLPVQRSFAERGDLVAEGRDIGTVIFPNADIKIFLIANVRERALRRVADLKRDGYRDVSLEAIEREIIKRDQIDTSREVSPLIKAPDAKVVDTSGKTVEQTVSEIIKLLRAKNGKER